jgi:hypothetical protein
MIKVWKYAISTMDKLPTYYKAKSQYSAAASMVVMLQNDISQKEYCNVDGKR